MAKQKADVEDDDDDDFVVPEFESVREFGQTVDKGWHSASLAVMEAQTAKSSGNKMLVATVVIDTGDFAGSKLTDRFVISGDVKIGWERLKKLAVAADFEWESVKRPKDLAFQFVDMDAPLRFDVYVDHQFTIKDGSTYKNGVTEAEFDRWKAQGGDGNIKGEIKDYRAVSASPPDLIIELGGNNDEDEGLPSSKDVGTARGPSRPPAGSSKDMDDFAPDDDLPF